MDARHLRQRQRALFLAAGAVVVLTLLGLRHPGSVALAASGLAWTGVLLAAGMLAPHPRWSPLAFYAAAAVSGIAGTHFVIATGGSTGPRFGFLLALAPLALVLVPDLPLASALAGACAVGGGFVIIARDGRGAWFALEWGSLAVALLALTALAAVGFRRLWVAELAAQAQLLETQRRLAESERERERAERVALVSKLGARLAHELNNPLAAVKANVAWLAGATLEGGAQPDTADVVLELAEGVERIGVIAANLRGLASVSAGEPAPRAVVDVLEEAALGVGPELRERLRLCVAPSLTVVVDGVLLTHCVRNLLVAAAALDERSGARGLRLEATLREGHLSIELSGEGAGAESGAAGTSAGGERLDGSLAVAGGNDAGLSLALADELARSMGGAVETFRGPAGGHRFVVRLPVDASAGRSGAA